MTVVIALAGILLLCALVTGGWIWNVRRRPLSAVDLRLQRVDRELSAADRSDEVAVDVATVSTTPITGIPLQRTGPPQSGLRRPTRVREPGSAA